MTSVLIPLPEGVWGFDTNYRQGVYVKANNSAEAWENALKSVFTLGLPSETINEVYKNIRVLEVI